MLTPYLPFPTNSGGQIRSYNLIKQLSKKHQITLCSLIKYDNEKKYVEKLRPYCKEIYVFKRPEKPFELRNILRTGFSLYPLLVVRNFSFDEKKALPQIIKDGNFDIIHAETFYVSPHIPKTRLPIVLVDQTIEYQVYSHKVKHLANFLLKPLMPLLYLDVLKIKYWETFYWKRASRVVAVSKRDANIMRYLVPKLKVTIVPNGVGDDLIADVPIHFSKKIVFIGNYAWLQNTEAARFLATEIFPKIIEKIPDARLVLAGQYAEKLKDLKTDSISVEDFELDDIEGIKSVFRNNGVLVAPIEGPGGSRLKILGAMAAKLPVITTKVGIAGIDAVDGESYLNGETVEEIVDATVRILSDKKLYEKIVKNARNFVEENYFYESIAKKLDQVYEEVVND